MGAKPPNVLNLILGEPGPVRLAVGLRLPQRGTGNGVAVFQQSKSLLYPGPHGTGLAYA